MLVGPGVEAFALSVGVEGPVLREVAVADEGPEGQDGFGSGDASPAASDVEPVGHQMTCGAFDDAAGDRPSGRECLVVVEMGGVVLQVVAGPVRCGPLVCGQAQPVGLCADACDGAEGVAGQDPRQCCIWTPDCWSAVRGTRSARAGRSPSGSNVSYTWQTPIWPVCAPTSGPRASPETSRSRRLWTAESPTRGVPRYRELDGHHLTHVHTGTAAPDTVWLRCRTRTSDVRIGMAARLTAEAPVVTARHEGPRAGQRVRVSLLPDPYGHRRQDRCSAHLPGRRDQ